MSRHTLFPLSLLSLLALCAAVFAPLSPVAAAEAKNSKPADVFEGMRKSFNAEKAKGVHARYLWNISGPDGGSWWIIVDDGKFQMGTGAFEKPDVTFTVSDKDWVAISNEQLSGSWAFITGRLKINGPQSTAKLLDGMFP